MTDELSSRIFYIYKITNKNNGKVYIGQTCNELEACWWSHKYNALSKGCRFHEAIRKHGPDSFDVSIICECHSLEESNLLEEKYISEFNSMNPDLGYNMMSGGSNVIGNKMSPDACRKITESKLGKPLMKRRNKTDERDRPIIEAFKSGMSRQEIAEKFNIGVGTVTKALHRWKRHHPDSGLELTREKGREQRSITYHKTIYERNKPITDRSDSGMRICDIARELNIDYNLVKHIVKRHKSRSSNSIS